MTGPDGLELEVKRLPGVTVVVMAYNEVDNLARVVAEILAALRGSAWHRRNSDRGRRKHRWHGGARGPHRSSGRHVRRVVHHGANQGLGQVYWTGLTQAEREFVTFFPADGRHSPRPSTDLFALARDGDLVLGYLPRRRDSIVGRLAVVGSAPALSSAGRTSPRFQGVLMVRRSILGGLQLQPSGRAASIVFEMTIKIVRAGYRVVSVPTAYRPRVTGHSKVNNLRTISANLSAMIDMRRRLQVRSSATAPIHRILPVLAVASAVVLCLGVYQPWSREPFDLLDFSEFLLQLRAEHGFADRFAKLATYYASQGRVNEIGYGLIAGSYQFFGLDPLGWQVVRTLPMLLIPPVAYLVLRRYGATGFGAAVGASLFLVGSVPASAWLRQTGEPVGTLFMLGAAAAACGTVNASSAWPRALAIGLCATGMLLSKETLVACLPFLLLTAACWTSRGEVRAPRFRLADGPGCGCDDCRGSRAGGVAAVGLQTTASPTRTPACTVRARPGSSS